jgi:hypothetical protein
VVVAGRKDQHLQQHQPLACVAAPVQRTHHTPAVPAVGL